MRLTPEQIAQFDRDGYLFFPGLFTPEETRNMTDAVPELYSRREAYNVREKGSEAVRTNFAAHMYSKPFAKLARHPRMVEPVEDLFGEKLYMHQFKINGKMAFEGDVWQWHQDFGTWLNDDMMPEPRCMNVAIFLDDVNEFNGPLMFIPGSHKKGVVEAKHDLRSPIAIEYMRSKARAEELVERGGVPFTILRPPSIVGSLPEWEFCTVPAAQSFMSKRLQECNWLQSLEGGIDSSHVSFLHRGSLKTDPLFKGAKGNEYNLNDLRPKFEVVEADGGLLHWRAAQGRARPSVLAHHALDHALLHHGAAARRPPGAWSLLGAD